MPKSFSKSSWDLINSVTASYPKSIASIVSCSDNWLAPASIITMPSGEPATTMSKSPFSISL